MRRIFNQINQKVGLVVSIFFVYSTSCFASDFSLPFVSVSELGNMYAGQAATAYDASTTFTNPAGLVKLQSPQLIVGGVNVYSTNQFSGTMTSLTSSQNVKTNGYMGGFLPLFYYSYPISENVVFGFGETVPFGLGTNYANDSALRYIATKSQVVDVDLTPSIGVKLNKDISVGFGLDFENLNLTLQSISGFPLSVPDARAQNYTHGWGYGFHTGILDQVTPMTRIGLVFHSQAMFHTNGYSDVDSPSSGFFRSYQRANMPLPAMTQLSIDHDFNSRWEGMATITYTHWSALTQVTLKNTVFAGGSVVPVTIPFQYHNTVDYALGVNYKPNQKWILRTGMQYLNTPSNDRFRSPVDPLGNAILIGLGVHYQQTRNLGYDVGYGHQFAQISYMHAVTPFNSAIGHEWIAPNIFGAQVTFTA